MKLFFVLATLQIVSCLIVEFPEIIIPENPSSNHARVFGGTVARDGQFPYMALVQTKSGNGILRCSASLISEDLILLAAHCFPAGHNNPENTLVVAGKASLASYFVERSNLDWEESVSSDKLKGAQERRAVEVAIHSKYSPETHVYDFALIKVSPPFQMTRTVHPVNISYERLNANTPCTIHGWGKTENTINNYNLIFAPNILVQPIRNCIELKDGPFYCLVKGNSGICQGDSGSPLICEGFVSGVASFLLAKTANPKCGEDFEEFYVDISSTKAWLEQKINEFTSPNPQFSNGEKESPPISPKHDTGNGLRNKPIFFIYIMLIVGHVLINKLSL